MGTDRRIGVGALLIALACVGSGSVGCRRSDAHARTFDAGTGPLTAVGSASSSAGASPTGASVPAVAKNAAPRDACPPIDPAKVEAFPVDRSQIDVDVPPIVDDAHAMAPFFERVAALARGTAKRHLRIGVYGDSNLTEDRLSGQMRRALQARFGDGGHGFVALARPWGWYVHQDVHHHGTWPLFKQIAVTTDPIADRQYGLGNFAAESRTAGAWVTVKTADDDAKVGRTASRFELFYLKQKRGGSFDVLLDGKPVTTVSTAADGFAAGYEIVSAPDEAHALKCLVKGDGPVRFFGATLEREPTAVQVDSLGCGSLNFQRMTMVDAALLREHVAHRAYDLVVVWLGMNAMWLEPNRQWIKDVTATLREAIPSLPVLLVTPPDSVKEGESKSDPRIVAVGKQLREVAKETGVAFWDMREAMGGASSFTTFMRKRLASPDRHHLLASGAELLGDRLVAATWWSLRGHLETHPDAGCTR